MNTNKLTFETFTNRSGKEFIRAVISNEDKGYPFIEWIGETEKKFLPKLKTMAKRAMAELEGKRNV